MRDEAIATQSVRRETQERWRGRVGTVVNKGCVRGAGLRLYVRWDGNQSDSCCMVTMLEAVPDDWGVEPATTG